ncbi:MAG: 50S ribosomal protein L7Ae [Candidatus Nanohaloarchaea archaeon]
MTYNKFEPSESLAESIYNAVEKARESGELVIGTNEATKAIERNEADLIVIAGNVSPEEVVMHLPALAEEKDVPFTFVPDKEELGLAAGIQVQAAAVAVTSVGNAEEEVEDVVAKSRELLDKEEDEEEE